MKSKSRRRGSINEYCFHKSYKNTGYVYIGAIAGIRGVYKIGRTSNINMRSEQLKREYGSNFYFLYISDLLFNYIDCEMYLHDFVGLDPIRQHEWFELGSLHLECVVSEIKRLEKDSMNLFEHENWENGNDEFDPIRAY